VWRLEWWMSSLASKFGLEAQKSVYHLTSP
jgi:hypothetical protein